jgi:glycerophosphoryl diester phosphodiesterase
MNKISKASLPLGFDIEGHRGCRGLLPENTIPAFEKALELGVTTLEMDLVISKDRQVVVSHEPYFNHEIATTPDKKHLTPEVEKKHNLFDLTFGEIQHYDVGLKIHPRFPSQKKIPTTKPLFQTVIDLAEKRNPTIQYNVEVKSTPEGDGLFHPNINEFCDLVCQLIITNKIEIRTIVQSFDLRALQYIKQKYPQIQLSLLIENELSPEFNIKILGFTPHVYSPDFHLVNQEVVALGKSLHMKIIPWTANTAADIQNLIDLGVDGIITDYPDIFN